MERQRNDGAGDRGRNEERQRGAEAGVSQSAVEARTAQVGDQNAEDRRGDRFDHLDRPDPAAKLEQLCLKRLGQLQPIGV